MALDSSSGVQNQHGETLALRIKERMGADVFIPVGRGLLGCFAALHLLGTGTFTKGHKLPLLRLVYLADGPRTLASDCGDSLGE